MGLKKHKYGIEPLWSSLEWKPLRYLIKGDHQGAIDGRSKCKRPTDGRGIAEFDGQSALTYWRGEFLVYARANPRERGYRAVQVCRGELKKFKPFQPCKFTGVPDASDIYFLHPYVIPGDRNIAVIMSLVWLDDHASAPGIYLALSNDGVNFQRPELLHSCKAHGRRAYDLPIQGNVSFTKSGIGLYVHQNVPCRMDNKDHSRPEKLVRVNIALEPHICALWSPYLDKKQTPVALEDQPSGAEERMKVTEEKKDSCNAGTVHAGPLPLDIIEPRLELELSEADNLMAVENATPEERTGALV